MNDIVITVSWEFFLGILGSIIALAYYSNGRFTRLETNFDWLSEALRNLTIKAENISSKAFDTGSPVSLTRTGRKFLEESGLESYIDLRRRDLVDELRRTVRFDVYDIQEAAFRLLDRHPFEEHFTQRLKKFAFENGISTDLLRRIGAIYLRDIALRRN